MIYFFDEKAGAPFLNIRGEKYKYLVKVRRHTVGDTLFIRSKESIENLHRYRITSVESRVVSLELLSSEYQKIESEKILHVAWCIVETKSIEKVLASLCEIGVSRISFIACQRSQRNFKLDFKRFDRIVEASMQQSGRTSFMEFDTYKSLEAFIGEFPDTKVFDFSERTFDDAKSISRVLIGCEGGFSPSEKEFLSNQEVFRLNTPMILRSESAVMAVASKILL